MVGRFFFVLRKRPRRPRDQKDRGKRATKLSATSLWSYSLMVPRSQKLRLRHRETLVTTEKTPSPLCPQLRFDRVLFCWLGEETKKTERPRDRETEGRCYQPYLRPHYGLRVTRGTRGTKKLFLNISSNYKIMSYLCMIILRL